ncbi:cell adhesion molecule DSCAML1-like [Dreissena polymorpha]|uniref:cell adhesion molecule DSCAML1-like n=1 Tax=Dreissena polymorpha TaxID=45954 RepID=UPI0022650103|nr:cell adhesion molecule DSCAML1-like [Dreissena polymorpha]
MFYTIKYIFERHVCRGKGDLQEKLTTVTTASAKLHESIFPYWDYIIMISAANTLGSGNYSNVLNVRTQASIPGDIDDITSSEVSSNKAEISWLDPCFSNGILDSFYVEIKNISNQNNDVEGWTATLKIPSNEPHLKLEQLLPFRNYSVRIKAANSAGNGSYGRNHEFQTAIDVPDVPSDVHSSTITSSLIEIHWSIATHYTGPTIYTVIIIDARDNSRIYTNKTNNGWGIDELATDCSVTGLDAFWNYSVTVIAETAHANLSYRRNSSSVIIQTAEDHYEIVLMFPTQFQVRASDGFLTIPVSLANTINVTVQVRAATAVGLGTIEEISLAVEPGGIFQYYRTKM